jgi:hypothetical protein
MDIRGTPDQQLIYLNTHWGRRYGFTAPDGPGMAWMATDKLGDHEKLEAVSATELMEAVRRHYEARHLPQPRA